MSEKGKILNKDYQYIIGIDLGTTNSAVSYVDLGETSDKSINVFKVPQLVGAGELSREKVLPSFLYIPGEYDVSNESILHPFRNRSDNFAGVFARDHGAKVPSRLVASAKSWLCHNKADRKSKILPWGSPENVLKVSPVEATAAYLNHIKKTWNVDQKDAEENFLENQLVVITVPASFDEVARELTLEAAALAEIKEPVLLEEPLAAFYSWLIKHEKDWADFIKPGELILVCDIGGGTTDFTLITLRETEGTPRFERIAVGDHLILGGDNIDLALARRVEMEFGKNKPKLTGDRWKMLCHQCRKAKEMILSGEKDSRRITLVGEGSSLIGGTVSANLTREMIESVVLEGFFAEFTKEDKINKKYRKGISEFGLPYEQEPAMTKHLGWFLEKHMDDIVAAIGKRKIPDYVLFNGGSLKPEVITEKIRSSVRFWFEEEDTILPKLLENPDPDLAVSLGAAYYGLVKTGKGVRVGSGSPRGYYLGFSGTDSTKKEAVCLVERGLDEGSKVELIDKKISVTANCPVSFELFSSSFRSGDKAGDIIKVDESLSILPPLNTIVNYGKQSEKQDIPVNIEAEYTETGTLVLTCKSLVSPNRWKLNFNLRLSEVVTGVSDSEVFDDSIVTEAKNVLRCCFNASVERGQKGNSQVTGIIKKIIKVVGKNKQQWPLSFLRELSDELIKVSDERIKNEEYENRWMNLLGYSLRPGIGHGLDSSRIKEVWKLFRNGPVFDKSLQVRNEWWILWRRVAAGLNPGQQRQFFQELSPVLFSGKKKKLTPQERIEVWMSLANMERLIVKDKKKCGDQLISEFSGKKTPPQFFWAISRFGAREPLYGSVDRVVPPSAAKKWVEFLMETSFSKDKNKVAEAIINISRKTGDISRDFDDEFIRVILSWMDKNLDRKIDLKPLTQVVRFSQKDENTIFGEALPAGIVLH